MSIIDYVMVWGLFQGWSKVELGFGVCGDGDWVLGS